MCAWGRVLAEPRLSPDGSRLAFVANVVGRAQIVVVDAAGGPELTVTSDPAPRPVASYGGGAFDWAPDGSGLVYAALDGGLWWVEATGGAGVAVLEGHRETPAAAPAVSPDGSSVAFVVDHRHVAVVALDPSGMPSWPRRLSAGADFCFDPAWSADGSTVAWHEWDTPDMPWDASRVVLRAVADAGRPGEPRLVAGGPSVQAQQPRFSPDGQHLGFVSDQTGWLNLWVADADGGNARALLDEPVEHGDPSWGLGQRSFAWSPAGDRIAFTRNDQGFGSLHQLDVASGTTTELGRAVHGGLSWAGDRVAAVRAGARTPTTIVTYETDLGAGSADGSRRRREVARGPVGGFEEAGLVEPTAVSWRGDDGAEVFGRLYRPGPGVDSATGESPPPLIVWAHGGPTGQWPVGFVARFAFFGDRGYAILVPDHRGSTGHGRAYTQAMRHRWGELDVADVAAGMRAAAANGWGDPRRMVPMGGSAGGFTVLNLLAHHPELCAAGVDLFGVTDLFDLDETTHRFEAHYCHSLVGPLPEAAAAYRDRSPLNVAERIEAPLLILQGNEDKVVPLAQSQSVADRLRALGRDVELHVYDGEGHGWLAPATIVDELTRIESFLRRHVLRRRSS